MRNKFYSIWVLFVVLCFVGCKEDEQSKVPTLPTTLSLEDGAVVETLNVKLSASGSTVEDDYFDVSYVYYIGKAADALEETSAEVTLEPYTQYFWRAQAITQDAVSKETVAIGGSTNIRTFYCVPPIKIETDNGDGKWAAVLRFKELAPKVKSGKITASSDLYEYEFDLTTGQDSCYLSYESDIAAGTNNAYTQWWDDEHGIYYEPIIYTFNVDATVQVGDKEFSITNTAKEIILDKQSCVRDNEYNVYRVVKIGNQTWLADDLRATNYIDENGNIVKLTEGEDFEYSKLKSGAVGVLYDRWCPILKDLENIPICPAGFKLASDADFLELEKYYGLSEPTGPRDAERSPNAYISIEYDIFCKYYEGEDIGIMLMLASKYDWENINVTNQNLFNAKPFYKPGECAFFLLRDDLRSHDNGYGRLISNLNKGIVRQLFSYYGYKGSLRCVKE